MYILHCSILVDIRKTWKGKLNYSKSNKERKVWHQPEKDFNHHCGDTTDGKPKPLASTVVFVSCINEVRTLLTDGAGMIGELYMSCSRCLFR